jgi:hypothetical protein
MLHIARDEGAGILLTSHDVIVADADGRYELEDGFIRGPLRLIKPN